MTLFTKKPDVYDAVKVLSQKLGDDPYTFDEAPDWLRQAIYNQSITAFLDHGEYKYRVVVEHFPVRTNVAGAGDYIIKLPDGTLSKLEADEFYEQFEAVTPNGGTA